MEKSEIQPLNNLDISNQEFNISDPPSDPESQQEGIYNQLNQLFNEQDKQQRDVQEAREILGDSAKDLTDSQVYDLVNEIQFLVDIWLEEFERKTFDGKTLNELIGLKP